MKSKIVFTDWFADAQFLSVLPSMIFLIENLVLISYLWIHFSIDFCVASSLLAGTGG